ncbi:MAG: AI-2E family transporter [Candidatus Paceibacterota bacterium]|jgi:predicted PurR-regulated permease PerM
MLEDGRHHIATGTMIRFLLVIAVAAAIFWLRDTLLAVVAAIFISSAIDPGVRWFEDRKIPRVIGVVAIYLASFSLIGFILLFVLPSFLTEASALVGNIPIYISQINDFIPILDQSILNGYVPLMQELAGRINALGTSAVLSNGSFSASATLFNSAGTLANVLVTIIMIVVLSFYFSVTKDGIDHFLRVITPLKHEEYVISLWTRTRRKIGAWMQGQIFLGALVGSLVFILLSILHVKHALALGIIAGLLEIIPVFGPVLAAIPGVMFALLDGGIGLALWVLLVYVMVQQFENHIFYPLVVRKMVGISPILVIISLVVGANLAGFMGILLSVPLSVLLVEYVADVEKKKTLAKAK